MITPSQIRMARAALGWSVHELGKRAGVAGNTVSRFENGSGAMVDTLERMQTALESAGVVFIPSRSHRRSWGSPSRGSSREGQTQAFTLIQKRMYSLRARSLMITPAQVRGSPLTP